MDRKQTGGRTVERKTGLIKYASQTLRRYGQNSLFSFITVKFETMLLNIKQKNVVGDNLAS